MAWTRADYEAQIRALAKYPGDMLIVGDRRVEYSRGVYYVERPMGHGQFPQRVKCSSAMHATSVLLAP